MNRTDRLLGILITLQSKKYSTVNQLAEKYDISVRTVYRDIRALNELGVPIGFENHKGYFIVQGYFLPPVSFSDEEANALTLISSLANHFTDGSVVKHLNRAIEKIKAVLDFSQKDRQEDLNASIEVYRMMGSNRELNYLMEIQNAISNKQLLKMAYCNSKLQESEREIEPIGLIFYAMDWHMIAWCWKRVEYRDFKVARIQKLINTWKDFKKDDHMQLSNYTDSFRRSFGP